MRRGALVLFVLLLAVTACGASIQAVYEGDVRFEHCMALDSRPDAKPTLRRACWEEWVKFYTFGQTRDRVDFAKLRQKQLSASSDFDEGTWGASATPTRAPPAVPEPTSVLAPPPSMMASDGGTGEPTDLDAGADAEGGGPEEPPPGSACARECDDAWSSCQMECKKVDACERGCDQKHKRCMRKCF
jgi:hypothetical protein